MSNYDLPVQYDYINAYNADITPSTHHASNAEMTRFFKRYLLQKAFSVFKWNLPENWSKDYFLYTLYTYGHLAIIKTTPFGVIPQQCSLMGYDVFYRPTHAVITNHLLKGITTPRIGTQCVLMKLQPDYGGIMDLVSYYAEMMALSAETASMNLANSKLSYLFFADGKVKAESWKSIFDDIQSGELAVVADSKLKNPNGGDMWQPFSQNVGQNYIVSELLTDLRKWENMFNTAIGIPNANTDKKERLITDEVNANNKETESTVDVWLELLQEACEKARNMFNIEISVDWRDKPIKEGGQDVTVDNGVL